MAQGPLPGFRDFYPEQFAERAHVMNVWRDVARRFAVAEYDGPPLETLELYTKKSGDEIVGQLYNFTDKGGREIALRPEMTPTLARMAGAKAAALRKPIRWFSMPQLFRYERQQRGRLREHFQLNVDIIGEADVTADAALLAVAIEVVRACCAPCPWRRCASASCRRTMFARASPIAECCTRSSARSKSERTSTPRCSAWWTRSIANPVMCRAKSSRRPGCRRARSMISWAS